MIKGNSRIFVQRVDNKTLDGISLKSILKMSKDIFNGKFKIKPIRRVL